MGITRSCMPAIQANLIYCKQIKRIFKDCVPQQAGMKLHLSFVVCLITTPCHVSCHWVSSETDY
jgi:hypothetical protein